MSLDGRIPCAVRILGPQSWLFFRIRTPEPIQVQPPVHWRVPMILKGWPPSSLQILPFRTMGKSDTSRHPETSKNYGVRKLRCVATRTDLKRRPAVRVVDGFHHWKNGRFYCYLRRNVGKYALKAPKRNASSNHQFSGASLVLGRVSKWLTPVQKPKLAQKFHYFWYHRKRKATKVAHYKKFCYVFQGKILFVCKTTSQCFWIIRKSGSNVSYVTSSLIVKSGSFGEVCLW